MSAIETVASKPDEPDRGRSGALRSYLLIAPSIIWMALFLVLPLAMIVYVSFWTQTTFKIEPKLTLVSGQTFFRSDTYLYS
jgi:putative spermidine/putrescine transport system permease protein